MAKSRTEALVLAVIVAFVTALVPATPSFAQDCAPGALCLPAGQACSNFDLQIESSGGEHYVLREFLNKDGNLVRALGAGKGYALTFTNLSTGATLATPANGSVSHTTYNRDGSATVVAAGHNGIILFPTDVPAGPSTTLYVGQVVYTIDPTGVWTITKVEGKSTDICAALSG